MIVNVILLWTLHDYPGLGVMSSIFSYALFEFFIQNASIPTHFFKLYLFKYKKVKKPMIVLLKQILQYKVATNAKNSKCLIVNKMSLHS
jgi:hypothetical protein